ncbi:MAG: hypothetical protein K9M55_00590 [Candidatus Marinimicrobia bacterium]|nr:hypothetical protein [Candidatus Neomarinimicrobiota bacterium]MCF7921175.1 hypothetical protein [Candidatus Neomarinimicrobiota bacterium]
MIHISRQIMLVTLLGLATLQGCWNPFAPTEGLLEGDISLSLTEQRSPEEVLQNFRYAYIYRDSLVYSDLFDTSFVFLYFDPEIGGVGGYDYWGRDTELRTTARLFRAFDHFTLIWNATIATDSLAVNKRSLTKTFDLTIGGEIFLSGNAVFDFISDPEGVWRISRWQDESFF